MSNQRMKQTEIAKVTLVHNDCKHFEEDQEVNEAESSFIQASFMNIYD